MVQQHDYLGIVNAVIAQHHAIMGQVKIAEGHTNDLESLFTLQRAYSSWSQSSMETLLQRQNNLEEVRSTLQSGLERHFGFEEKYLPPLLGDFLLQSLAMTHHTILIQFTKAKPVLANPQLPDMKQEDLLIYKLNVEEVVSQLCQAVDHHLNNEEVLLAMLKGVLEKGNTG